MATSARDSSLNLVFKPLAAEPNGFALPAGFGPPPEANRELINGKVIGCACPDCRGPMTIRLWLMTADCWRCGTSIELSLEQERELLEALAEEAAAIAPDPQPRESPPPPPEVRSTLAPRRPQAPAARPVAPPPPPIPSAPPPPPLQTPSAAPAPLASGRRAVDQFLPPAGGHGHALRDLTAWLVSAVFHAVMILLLGMWTFGEEEHAPELVLSVSLSKDHRTGGDPSEVAFNTTDFDLPIDKKPNNKKEREMLVKANQEARELRLDPLTSTPQLPPLSRVKADLKSADPLRRMQAARDPRVRAEIVKREGGTTLTEAAVARGLRWMAGHQSANGSWSLDRFHQTGECNGRCDHGGQMTSDPAGTALVLMAMLGTGQTHKVGIYRGQVGAGLAWMVANQKPNGDLRGNSAGHSGMYAHALAAIALCDAFKMTGDETLRAPAQRAIDFICEAQHSAGGWRYQPGEVGDTSVLGWQIMALHSARSAYLRVPDQVLERTGYFLDSVQADDEGGLYSYQRGRAPSPTINSVGLLSRMYLGWDRNDAGLGKGVELLSQKHLPSTKEPDIYYWYYATQVMHHWGGEPWDRWNRALREALVTTQVTSGHAAGSWDPRRHPHGQQGGRLYVTALSTCTLEVYYRYAPLYHQLDLD